MHFEALVSIYRSFLVMAPWTFQLGRTNPSLCPLRAHSGALAKSESVALMEVLTVIRRQPLWPTRRTQLYCLYIQLNTLAYFSVNARVYTCARGWVGPKQVSARSQLCCEASWSLHFVQLC